MALLAGAEVSLTILVAEDSKGKAVYGDVVPQKGVDPHRFAADILMKKTGWLDYTAISLRLDSKPAVFKLLRHAVT